MQISVKTPAELTPRVLEKCAILGEDYPSSLASACVWQCLTEMNNPHRRFRPLAVVQKYFLLVGKLKELQPSGKKGPYDVSRQLMKRDSAERAEKAAQRLEECREKLKREGIPKHLHLKISEGGVDLIQQVRGKANWLRLKPNALVVACLRDCLDAMDDPKKALLPPPVVVDFWTATNSHLRPNPKDAIEAMVLLSQEGMLRERSGPILDTLIRYALKEEWKTPLEQILRDAGVFPEDEKPK